jgi:molybdopterin synthase sulfur carrier subunit
MIYFAAVRDLVGKNEEELESSEEELTLDALIHLLQSKHERLIMEGVRVAVNEEFAEDDVRIKGGDVVALIPPVSGG